MLSISKGLRHKLPVKHMYSFLIDKFIPGVFPFRKKGKTSGICLRIVQILGRIRPSGQRQLIGYEL